MKCRQNWSETCENALNNQIKAELQASYDYHILSTYFFRDDIGLDNMGVYFDKASLEEREHANKLIRYQTKRGGIVTFSSLTVPDLKLDKEFCVKEAFTIALTLEKQVNEHLLKLHQTATDDPQFSDFLEGEFLSEQVDAISDISKKISQLELIGNDGHGIWEFVNKL